jgi:hypothetical protein
MLRRFLLNAFLIGCGAFFGCGGNLGSAVQGVQQLQPEAEKRNREIEELANPSSARQKQETGNSQRATRRGSSGCSPRPLQ